MANKIFGNISQQGYVVKDIDQAVESWSSSLGIGPWVVIKGLVFKGKFEGRATAPVLNIALAYDGDQQIELIQPLDTEPSPYFCNGSDHCGPHHVGYFYDGAGYSAAVEEAERNGMTCAFDVVSVTNARYSYYLLPNLPQSYIEFIELDAGSKELFEQLKTACQQEYSNAVFQLLEF